VLYIYNNIAKIILLQLLQREQVFLLFMMVHTFGARSPPLRILIFHTRFQLQSMDF